jgi:LysM repeat protein
MKKAVLFGLMLALVVSILPLAAFTPKAEAGGCKAVYVVRRGDTLVLIARRYHTTVGVIANANHIKNRNHIVVGKRLCIPGNWTPDDDNDWPPPPPGHWPPPPPPHPWPLPCQHPSGCYPPPQPGLNCSITPVQGFGNVWYGNSTVRNRLGCPTAVEQGFTAVDEPFCNGYVVEDVNGKVIYVLFNNHRWEQRPATWTQGDPVTVPGTMPPYGFYVPQYSIGKMWGESDLMQRLSWAYTPQRSVSATRQPFDGGMMLWTSVNGVYVLYNDGTWSR